MPVGVWDGWAQLWLLRAPSGRETVPALGIQPSTAASQPPRSSGTCHLVPWLVAVLVPFWDGVMLPPWCRIELINETAVTSSCQPRVKKGGMYLCCLSPFLICFLLSFPPPPSPPSQVLRSISVIALPSAITLRADFQEPALPGRCHPVAPLP